MRRRLTSRATKLRGGRGGRGGRRRWRKLLPRSEEHTSELQSPCNLVCRLLLEKKKIRGNRMPHTFIRPLASCGRRCHCRLQPHSPWGTAQRESNTDCY